MIETTTIEFRLDLLWHVDQTFGGIYWAWSLASVDGERRAGGRVADLTGEFRLDGGDPTAEAERVADEVCRRVDIDRANVVLAVEGIEV